MNAQIFSDALGEISEKYIEEALTYQRPAKRKRTHIWLKRCIAACLAIVLCFGTLLATSETVSAAFFGWLKETYEMFFVYRSPGGAATSAELMTYRPGWVPEGYSEDEAIAVGNGEAVYYTNEQGMFMTFSYADNSSATGFFVDVSQTTKYQVEVNGCSADLFISNDPNASSCIMWINEHNTAFYISAFLDGDELIQLAESVTEVD